MMKKRRKEQQQQQDMSLPFEVWAVIFQKLKWRHLQPVRESCHLFRRIVDQHIVACRPQLKQTITRGLWNSRDNDPSMWAYWHNIFSWTKEDVGIRGIEWTISRCLPLVCCWMHQTYGFTRDEITQDDNRVFRTTAFNAHCVAQFLCSWLYHTFQLSTTDVRACNNEAFANAASRGNLLLCDWMVRMFTLTADEAIESGAFHNAIQIDDLKLCKWMHRTFQFTTEQVRAQHNRALYTAATWGNLSICVWLHKTFRFTTADATDCGAIFAVTAGNRYWAVCRWLWSVFDFTAKDMSRDGDDHALVQCAEMGHVKLCKWLTKVGGLTRHNSLSIALDALCRAIHNKHFMTADWLRANFQITHEDEPRSIIYWYMDPMDSRVSWMNRYYP